MAFLALEICGLHGGSETEGALAMLWLQINREGRGVRQFSRVQVGRVVEGGWFKALWVLWGGVSSTGVPDGGWRLDLCGSGVATRRAQAGCTTEGRHAALTTRRRERRAVEAAELENCRGVDGGSKGGRGELCRRHPPWSHCKMRSGRGCGTCLQVGPVAAVAGRVPDGYIGTGLQYGDTAVAASMGHFVIHNICVICVLYCGQAACTECVRICGLVSLTLFCFNFVSSVARG